MRLLIETHLIPDDVTIQVLTQAREHLIKRPSRPLEVPQAIVHLYNSTSELQRRVVFRMEKKEIIALAVSATALVKLKLRRYQRQTSGSSILRKAHGTGMTLRWKICEAVWTLGNLHPIRRMILNIPATVEMSTPNVYADRVELFCRSIKDRERAIVSVHAHNDRGTAVASDRTGASGWCGPGEGTLFGNGERTGNVDIVTVALNLFSQGIDPRLDFSNIIGSLGCTNALPGNSCACSPSLCGRACLHCLFGSHQDAIKQRHEGARQQNGLLEVPYLPIDPADVGRTYESIIRINSHPKGRRCLF